MLQLRKDRFRDLVSGIGWIGHEEISFYKGLFPMRLTKSISASNSCSSISNADGTYLQERFKRIERAIRPEDRRLDRLSRKNNGISEHRVLAFFGWPFSVLAIFARGLDSFVVGRRNQGRIIVDHSDLVLVFPRR